MINIGLKTSINNQEDTPAQIDKETLTQQTKNVTQTVINNDKSIYINSPAATSNLSKVAIVQSTNIGTVSDCSSPISPLTTADIALTKVSFLLQQGKDLAKQAVITQDTDARKTFQNELTKILQLIDPISSSTNYETTEIVASSSELTDTDNDKKIIDCLKTDWLEEAEKVVEERYGLTADGATLNVVLDETPEPYLAAINYNYGSDGKASNESLHIAVDTTLPADLPNGGKSPYYDDRIITHEMVHAIMGRTMNFASFPKWFTEGTAEFIQGADERVATDLARNGGGMEGALAIQNALGDGTDNTWVNNSLHYSTAEMAVRYLHNKIKDAGYSGGIKDLLTDLKNNPTETLNDALSHVSNYDSVNDFVADFKSDNNAANFINKLDTSGEFVRCLLGGDTGAIGGSSVDGGPVQTSKSVIPDIYYPNETPLKHFNIIWPSADTNLIASSSITDEQSNSCFSCQFKLDDQVLELNKVDLINAPQDASTTFDNAISYVLNEQNKLNFTLHSLVQESLATLKNSPEQSSMVIAVQANHDPVRVLQLLT